LIERSIAFNFDKITKQCTKSAFLLIFAYPNNDINMSIIAESWKLAFESNYTQHRTDRNVIVMMLTTALLVYRQVKTHLRRSNVCELHGKPHGFDFVSWPIV